MICENWENHTPRKDDKAVAVSPLNEPKRGEYTAEALDVEKAFVAGKNVVYSAFHRVHLGELQHDVMAFGVLSECYLALEMLSSLRDPMASTRSRTRLDARRVLSVEKTPYGY
jgi:hypothetical protein